ncbi:MAG: PspC domain-containing protein [Streptococcus salivarius]
MKKELRRDPNNKIIAGVCSGIAKYLDIDPVIIRTHLKFAADFLIWNRFSFLHHLLNYYPRRESKW